MKKHDEGYTLPFVLVILTILYFVVSIVLTSAETTVTAQQQSIAQMKQKYAAQGKIEMLVGQLCDVNEYVPLADVTDETEAAELEVKIEATLLAKINGLCSDISNLSTSKGYPIKFIASAQEEGGVIVIPAPTLDKTPKDTYTYTFTVISEHDSITITSQMVLGITIEKDADDNFKIVPNSIDYNTYQIGGDAP